MDGRNGVPPTMPQQMTLLVGVVLTNGQEQLVVNMPTVEAVKKVLFLLEALREQRVREIKNEEAPSRIQVVPAGVVPKT